MTPDELRDLAEEWLDTAAEKYSERNSERSSAAAQIGLGYATLYAAERQ